MPLLPSPAVVRAGDLLLVLAESPTVARSASELARRTGVPRATCTSLLLGLMATGLVVRDEDLCFRLGPAAITIGDAARVANPAFRAAARHGDLLARARSAVAAVSIRDEGTTRVAEVFDHGPPFGLRPRAGDTIALVPPFGAAFVAWDDDAGVEAWLDRAQPPLDDDERERYRAALAAVRARGFSVSVTSDRQAELATALERLTREPGVADAVSARDIAMREIAHGDYLATELGPDSSERLLHVSAPVFLPNGHVGAAIMLLGPSHEISASETIAMGREVVGAAAAATDDIGGVRAMRR